MSYSRNVFQKKVLSFYAQQGRNELPWRLTKDPYYILVSEVMLQQTQVDRVVPKFLLFIEKFPTVEDLSRASLKEVLFMWSGLGYNRRAKMLQQAAFTIVHDCNGVVPHAIEQLESLSGVGPYTARAVMIFAYNQPMVCIETNIRSVFLHEFFPGQSNVHDDELRLVIEQTLKGMDPRIWYWALMDYGTYLKKMVSNPSRKSAHHTKQPSFKGSLRQVRGEILSTLLSRTSTTYYLNKTIDRSKKDIDTALQALRIEGFITKKGKMWSVVI